MVLGRTLNLILILSKEKLHMLLFFSIEIDGCCKLSTLNTYILN